VIFEKIFGGCPGFQNGSVGIDHMLRGDNTHLFCAGDDVLYPTDAIIRLVNADKDVICGIYRKNIISPIEPANACDSPAEFLRRYREGGVYETQFSASHSMTIKREVIEKMILDYPELAYIDAQTGSYHYALFLPMIHEGQCFQDDFSFSIRARKSGFKLWDDYGCRLKHFCSGFLGFDELDHITEQI
jgi:hypothetical protein